MKTTRQPRVSVWHNKKFNSGIQYKIAVYRKNTRFCLKRSNHVKIIKNWKGMVYDVTLEKNHILYVRRNGKAIWSGNSGTTAVASKQLKRNFIGFEITPHYANVVIKERLEQEQMERWFE